MNDGTSLSTAIISGVAALVRSRYPDLDAANVVNRLIRTARDEGPSGRDPRFGFGVVDPLAALTRSVPPVSANPLLEAAPPAPTASSSRDSRDDEPMVTFGLAKGAGPAIATALCLLVVVAVVVLLVWLTRRGVRRPAAPTAPGPHPPLGPPPGHRPPGFGPPTGPGQFPGYPPPSGNGPPPGFAPSAGPVPAHPYQPRPVSQPTAPHPYPPPAGPVPPATGPVPPPTGPEQG